MMEKNRRDDDLALRRVIDEQAQKAKGMKLSEGFADGLMREIDGLPESVPTKVGLKRGMVVWRKIAAVMAVAVVIGGIAYAAYYSVRQGSGDTPVASVTPGAEDVAIASDSVLRFEGLKLDSILNVVSQHYGRTVCFKDKSADTLRLSTVWDRNESLKVFIETINEFDGLLLTDSDDTIFVESVKVEE